MKNIKAVLYYEWIGTMKALRIFGIVLLSVVLLSFIMAMTMQDGNVYMGGTSIAIYAFLTVSGFINVKDSMPYCIRRGSSRKGFITAIFISFLSVSLIMSIFHTVLIELSMAAGQWLNLNNVFFFRFADLITPSPSILTSIAVDFFVSFFCLASSFFAGTIFIRFGKKAGFTLFGLLFLAFITPTIQEKVGTFLFGTSNQAHLSHFAVFFAAGIVLLMISWPIVRRISISPSIQ